MRMRMSTGSGIGFAGICGLVVTTLVTHVSGQGGDNAGIATPIGLCLTDTGTTIGYTDSSDEICPFAGSTSPDVYYSYTPAEDHLLSIVLCESSYDTKVYVYDSGLALVELLDGTDACNDDACSDSMGNAFRSRLDDVPVVGGFTYFVVVDGFNGDAGPYALTLFKSPPEPDCLAACCLPNDCLVTTEDDCTSLGGIFLFGRPCEERVRTVIHTADAWTHVIEMQTVCVEPLAAGAPCVDGPAKIDAWTTDTTLNGSNCEDFGSPFSCPIPADFFGPGSEPFTGEVCFEGVPIPPILLEGFDEPIDFGLADTLVRRSADPFDRCDLPSPRSGTVDITLEQLNLVSIDPITVTHAGGGSSQWRVQVFVDGTAGQPGGTLTATKDHCNGGTFDSVLAACPTFVFIPLDPGFDVVVLDYCAACDPGGIVMTSTNGPWVHDPVNIQAIAPVCSSFVPGIVDLSPTIDCDCNGNGVRDTCDIEDGTSGDCNDDGLPDECAPVFCATDIDGDCTVGFPDLLRVLSAWGPCAPCPEDIDGNGVVGFPDLLAVLSAWGPC